MDSGEFIEVSLGDILKYIKDIRTLRDAAKGKLKFKVPSNYVIEGGDVYIRPHFTDGFAVAISSSKRPSYEINIWWSHLIDALNGTEVDWVDYNIKINGEVKLEVYDNQGNRFITMKIDNELISKLEKMLNASFVLSLIDWFIEDNVAAVANYTENYTKLRYIGDFVENLLNELKETGLFNELVEGVRKIEIECGLNNHLNRDVVNVIPVGKFYLCSSCLRKAEKFVDETLESMKDRKITVPRNVWEGLRYSIEYAKDLAKSLGS